VQSGELGDRLELGARCEDAAGDLVAERCGKDLIRRSRATLRGLRPSQDLADGVGGAAVGLGDPCSVDPEGGRAAAPVAEAPGDRAHVDTRGDELSGGVVTQRVQALAAQLETFGELSVALGCRPRPQRD